MTRETNMNAVPLIGVKRMQAEAVSSSPHGVGALDRLKNFAWRAGPLALTAALAMAALAGPAFAAGDIIVKQGGNFTPITVAVTPMVGDDAKIGAVVAADFARSVFLQPLDPATFPDKIANPDVRPNFDAWKTINAQFVVTGAVQHQGGKVVAQYRLWDVTTGEQIAAQEFAADAWGARRVSHLIADGVFEKITGEGGFFDSRVTFVEETGPKNARKKQIAVMDMDGANVTTLTTGDALAVTPRFSPSGHEVAYMQFGHGDPRVSLINLESGAKQVVGDFHAMSFAPRFSPDGGRLALSVTNGPASDLYSVDLRTHAAMRLTDGSAIDSSPSYSPDGSQIAFESDRGGSQQIYVMSASGGDAKRISFGDGRYSTPVWSPRGDLIAFTRIKGGSFGIGVMKPDGSGERILVEGFHNEGPTFAPNGLYLMFFRSAEGSGGPKLYMTDIFGHAEFLVPTPNYASDPSWGPLLQ